MKWLKVGAIVFASVAVTTLAIDAADTFNGSRSTLLGQLILSDNDGCPAGMVTVPAVNSFRCADMYEVSAGEDCPHHEPANFLQTAENIDTAACGAVSQADVLPWRFITREQAQTACLRSGKRLITAQEWFMVAAGTPDTESCNINSSGVRTAGADPDCVSAVGIYDTIGNAWEWTSDDVIDGKYNDKVVPASGYVLQVDAGGFPTVSGPEPTDLFFADYFWSAPEGAFGLLRGGFYGSQSDAGVYAVHAETLPTHNSAAIGFRCVL